MLKQAKAEDVSSFVFRKAAAARAEWRARPASHERKVSGLTPSLEIMPFDEEHDQSKELVMPVDYSEEVARVALGEHLRRRGWSVSGGMSRVAGSGTAAAYREHVAHYRSEQISQLV